MVEKATRLFTAILVGLSLFAVASLLVLTYAIVIATTWYVFGPAFAISFVLLTLTLPAMYAIVHLPEDIRAIIEDYRWLIE